MQAFDEFSTTFSPTYDDMPPSEVLLRRGEFLVNHPDHMFKSYPVLEGNSEGFPVAGGVKQTNRLANLLRCMAESEVRYGLYIRMSLTNEKGNEKFSVYYVPGATDNNDLLVSNLYLLIRRSVLNILKIDNKANEVISCAVLGYLSILTDSCSVSIYKHGNEEFEEFVEKPFIFTKIPDCSISGCTLTFDGVQVGTYDQKDNCVFKVEKDKFSCHFVSIRCGAVD